MIGTDYAPISLAKESLAPLAATFGLEKIVREHPARIDYFTALRCLRDAHALILPGSDDPGYTASKVFPCILANRPLLGLFHRQSSSGRILAETGAGTVLTFAEGENPKLLADQIYRRWFQERAYLQVSRINDHAFAPYRAETMASRITSLFDAACTLPNEGR